MDTPFGQNDQMTFGQNGHTNTNDYTMITNNDVAAAEDENVKIDILNEKGIAEITKCYEENIGMLTPASAELLYSYLKDFPEDIICQAIKKASINGKRNCKYVCAILNDWNSKNIKNLLDIEKEEKQFETRKNKIINEETEEEKMARKIKSLQEAFGSGD